MRAHVLVGRGRSSRPPPGGRTSARTSPWRRPPFAGSRASTSSGMLRGWSQTAREEECEKITGAVEVSSASRMVFAATCERSTSMPLRFISRTTSWPKAVSPPTPGSSVAESAHAMLSLWVRVMYRTPSAYRARSVASELLMEWPPSAPIRDAIRPSARAAFHIAAAVSARTQFRRVAGDQLVHEIDLLQCRADRLVARSDPHARKQTRTVPLPRLREAGVDRCAGVHADRRPHRSASRSYRGNRSRIAQGKSLWPSTTGNSRNSSRASSREVMPSNLSPWWSSAPERRGPPAPLTQEQNRRPDERRFLRSSRSNQ